MELVEGCTLHQWLCERSRRRRDILRVFLLAGEAIAAAHRGNVVHCDFKPDNVMVTANGRVRVLDFGIARAAQAAREAQRTPEGYWPPLGTPAFMSPEQHLGLPTDERTDQFSFCVALYTALCGARPFAGATVRKLRQNVVVGRVAEPPAAARLPRWLGRVLRRGMAVLRDDRYSSMDALLAALRTGPLRGRRRLSGVGSVPTGTRATSAKSEIGRAHV